MSFPLKDAARFWRLRPAGKPAVWMPDTLSAPPPQCGG